MMENRRQNKLQGGPIVGKVMPQMAKSIDTEDTNPINFMNNISKVN